MFFALLATPLLALQTVDAAGELRLLIHGGGGMDEECDQHFVRLAGGTDAKLVVIPTARSDASIPTLERTKEVWSNTGITDIRLLHTRDRNEADDDSFSAAIVDADAVWISGGSQQRLADAYAGTLVEKGCWNSFASGRVRRREFGPAPRFSLV